MAALGLAAGVGAGALGFLYARHAAWQRAETASASLRATAELIPGADPSAVPKASERWGDFQRPVCRPPRPAVALTC